jgi:hypothetical protein
MYVSENCRTLDCGGTQEFLADYQKLIDDLILWVKATSGNEKTDHIEFRRLTTFNYAIWERLLNLYTIQCRKLDKEPQPAGQKPTEASGGKIAETSRELARMKRWGVKKIICLLFIFLLVLLAIFRVFGWPEPIKAVKMIYYFIPFLAALLTCLHHMGWLALLKEFIYGKVIGKKKKPTC